MDACADSPKFADDFHRSVNTFTVVGGLHYLFYFFQNALCFTGARRAVPQQSRRDVSMIQRCGDGLLVRKSTWLAWGMDLEGLVGRNRSVQ